MNNNKFGATSLSSKVTTVDESKVAELYATMWNDTLTLQEKQDIAKQLGLSLPDSMLNMKFEDLFDEKALDAAWSIIGSKLDESHLMTLQFAAKCYANIKHIDEGLVTWLVGAVIARKIWQKLSKSFKNKILKTAGVPDPMLNKYNRLSIDELPITYKDAVMQTLKKHGVKVDESDNHEPHEFEEYIVAMHDAQQDAKAELVQQPQNFKPTTVDAMQSVESEFPMTDFISTPEFATFVKSKLGSNAYYAPDESGISPQQQVQNIAGIQFEEALQHGDAAISNSLFWQLDYDKRVKLLELFDAKQYVVESFDDNVVAVIEWSKHVNLDQATLLSLTLQFGYAIASAMNAKDEHAIKKAYADMSASSRMLLHNALDLKFVNEEQYDIQTLIDIWSKLDMETRYVAAKEAQIDSDELDTSFDEFKKEDADKLIAWFKEHDLLNA